MSYSNDFKAFAIGSGANVETPTTWAGDSVVNLGFQSGTALSIKFNTVLRQASSMAQMIGDFTAQYGSGNVQDNGNITTLKTQFISALGGLLGNGIFKADDTGTANAVAIVVPNITLGAGQCFLVKKSTSGNTGATTINLNATSPVSVLWANGTALGSGDWPANATALVEYDGTQFNLLSVTNLGAGSATFISNVRSIPALMCTAFGNSQSIPYNVNSAFSSYSSVSNAFTTSVFTGGNFFVGAGEAGVYDIVVTQQCASLLGNMMAFVYLNGSPVGFSQQIGTTNLFSNIFFSTTVRLAVGDQVYMAAYQASPSFAAVTYNNYRITLIRVGA